MKSEYNDRINKIYLDKTVYEATLKRMRLLFDEFPNVVASFSGGKDSTVVVNMALKVAEEKGRLPLKVMFIDQEAEWLTVIDYVRKVMSDDRIEPLWFQMPIRLFNATSTKEAWLHCWGEGEDWIRPREDISIKENNYGTDRFKKLFKNILKVDYPDTKTCYLSGVRTEESPARYVALTGRPTYKHITWGKVLDKKRQHFTFYPLYDWSYVDIWHAIADNGWDYCKIYDLYYQYGIPATQMRVSNVHHETAIHSLFFLQEVEPDNWDKIANRISGIDTAGKMGKANFFVKQKDLPFMFTGWKEYRDYLLEKLTEDPKIEKKFRRKFKRMDKKYADMANKGHMYREMVNTIIANDFDLTKLQNWERRPAVYLFRKWKRGDIKREEIENERNRYFIPEE